MCVSSQGGASTSAGLGGATALKDEEEKKEFFDSDEEFARKVDLAAAWFKESKRIIVFTGAGISTRWAEPL